MKRLDLWLAATLVLICYAWFALCEVYEVCYDDEITPLMPGLGGLFVFLLPMFVVYLARELMHHRRWSFLWAWLWAFAAFSLAAIVFVFVLQHELDGKKGINWGHAIVLLVVFVYAGVANAVDAFVARLMQDWKWCAANRHLISRLIVRFFLTSTGTLILMRILYEVADASRMR